MLPGPVDNNQGGGKDSAREADFHQYSESTAMSSSLRVIVVCATLATWIPAQAQFLGPALETNVELNQARPRHHPSHRGRAGARQAGRQHCEVEQSGVAEFRQ